MTEMIVRCPLQEPELRHRFGAEPDALFHLCGRQTLAPAAGAGFGKVHKGTHRRLKWLQLCVKTAAAGRDEAGSDAAAEVKLTAAIETYEYGIESVCARRVPADDQLLRKLNPHLRPCSAAFALLVGTGKLLGDHFLQTMLPDKRKHLFGWDLEAL